MAAMIRHGSQEFPDSKLSGIVLWDYRQYWHFMQLFGKIRGFDAMTNAMTDLAGTPPIQFEAALRELERVISEMESGQLSLEQSLVAYQRGAELLQSCQSTLDRARQQVEILENNLLQPYVAPGTPRDA